MSSRLASPAPSARRPLALHAPHTLRALLAAAAVAAAGAAIATPPRPDPLDARAAAPAPVHRSPLQSYRRLPEVAPPEGARWREGNETVNRVGGWRAYAREAAAAAAAAASAPAGESR